MDREQEKIQFLGFFGILKELCNLLSSWRKIFTQISLFLIFPLSLIYLAQIQITDILFTRISSNENMLDESPQEDIQFRDRISSILASEWSAFILFKLGYFLIFVVLSLLSTSAVVYTIACIYTAKEISFSKVMNVVPKVWKRLILTFLCNFIILSAYNVVSLLLLIIGLIFSGSTQIVGAYFIGLSIVYLCGLLYITIIWQLASVVSVLEEEYGQDAMKKSKNLIKGKMGITASVFLLLGMSFIGVEQMFKFLVVFRDEQGLGIKIGYGIICLFLLSVTILFNLVAQTIAYFVCKSYHREKIDKSSLADHLGEFLGEYVPLKSNDVQLQQFEI